MDSWLLINDLVRHTRSVDPSVREAIERVVTNGWFVLGNEVDRFEAEFAAYCGVPLCVSVANGTDAIELALRALSIKPGQRVANVSNSGFYATTAILALGAEPVYVDVEPVSQCMDLAQLGQLLSTDRIDAVIVTHLFGHMVDMTEVLRLTAPLEIPVVEDCAQANGAMRNGRKAGSFGHAGCFSFYPTKNLGAIGDGGAVVTSDPQVGTRLKQLRQYGWDTKYRVNLLGGRNSRLDEIQAAVLRAKLPYLDSWNARRRQIAARYSSRIDNARVTCPPVRGEEYVGHLYVIEATDRDGLLAHLGGHKIKSDVHYPVPDHMQIAFRANNRRAQLPITEKLSGQILTLPCFPEMNDAEIDYVTQQINKW